MFLKLSFSTFLAFFLVSVPFTTSSPSGISAQNILHRTVRQASCEILQFRCNNGDCISTYSVCDGPKDCSDGSDETRDACRDANISCPDLSFECAYGACIDGKLRCDKKEDCADGSDEANCPTPGTPTTRTPKSCGFLKYKCANGQCINTFDTCDGIKHCDDGTDETKELCEHIQCLRGNYQCAYGACMDLSVKCNGKFDCPDRSDEYDDCPTRRTIDPSETNQPLPAGSCRLPSHPNNGFYTACGPNETPKPACRNEPGTVVDNRWSLKYTCNNGYSLDKESEYSICEDGRWKNEPKCIKLCDPLVSQSVHVSCKYKGKEVPCDQPMKPGTVATPECNMFYELSFVPPYKSLLCLNNGKWTDNLYQCSPVCGVSQAPSRPLMKNGIESKQGEFPWLAALYLRTADHEFEQICGGTLITPHIVLTAGHCVVAKATRKRLHPRDLKVGLGKFYRDFKVEEEGAEIIDVLKVVVPEMFAGSLSNYAKDIALLDLVVSVKSSAVIRPACLDWRRKYKPQPYTVGKVAGWGATEDHNRASNVTLYANMTYIPYADCLKSLSAMKKYLLTHDKFCAGSINGSRVDTGDSGGGLTFISDGQYFVIGIVSTKFTDGGKIFTSFTDITVSEHISWLEEKTRELKALREL